MAERLRIAQIAPLGAPVTPWTTGSIEQLVSLLTEELVHRGHTVTLFAADGSVTSASLHVEYPEGYAGLSDWRFSEVMNAAAAFERAAQFDIIHSHAYHYALPFTRLVGTPGVYTYHVLPAEDVVRCFARFPEVRPVAVSEYQRSQFAEGATMPVVHHGIDVEAFPFSRERGEYLLFLGRVIPRKGVAEAIDVARRVGMRLIVAGSGPEEYLSGELSTLLAPPCVEHVGPVDVERRNALLAGAAALVYPINEPESFGLVLVEAMACGTPVVALNLGAVPEIVENGVTGYFTRDIDSFVAAISAACKLDRTRIRERAWERFDYRHMVDGYEAVYRRAICERRRAAS